MFNAAKRLAVNEPTGDIKGSFVNLGITIGVGALILIGAFRADVAANLKTMETLIIGFFTASFGIWAGKKVFEMKTETNERIATKKGGSSGVIEKDPDGID